MNDKNKVYQIITDRVIEGLQRGEIPWHKPWNTGPHAYPCNLESKRNYRGINFFLLYFSDYSSPYYLTWNQIKKRNGRVKKGEAGHIVTFFKMLDIEKTDKATGEKESARIPFLRYYKVWNVEQTEGIDYPKPEKQIDFVPIDRAQEIVENMPKRPEISHNELKAYYRPGEDRVNMPNADYFRDQESYYSTMFHELTHSTGHESRLDRHRHENNTHQFASDSYSKEELTAEMGAAFLCAVCNIETEGTREETQAYINNWISKLKSDPKLVVQAASKAQAAADFILAGMEKADENDTTQAAA